MCGKYHGLGIARPILRKGRHHVCEVCVCVRVVEGVCVRAGGGCEMGWVGV